MTWAIAAGTITQSGTDTNLAGLAGVAGVTTITVGTRVVYLLPSATKLTISGTLTFDPRYEEIHLRDDVITYPQVLVSGTLTLGVDITVNSVRLYPQCTAFWIPSFNSTEGGNYDDQTKAAFRVTGTMDHYYGAIFLRGPVGLGSAATTGTYRSHSPSACWFALGQAGLGPKDCTLRQRSNNNVFAGLTSTLFLTPIGNWSSLSGVKIFHAGFSYSYSSSSPTQTWITIRDYERNGTTYDSGFRLKTVWARYINSKDGSNHVAVGNDATAATPNNCGLFEIRQELTVTAKNLAGAVITSGGIFTRDKANGNQTPYSDTGFGAARTNYEQHFTYTANFNGSGQAAITANGGVLTAVLWRANGGAQISTENKVDYRSDNNGTDDQFAVRVRSYGYLFQTLNLNLKGIGGTAASTTLFVNSAIAEPVQATAKAYAGITITDHGGSPVAWNGKNWGITVTGDLTTNPSLTAQQIHDYMQAHLSDVGVTVHGKLGGEWHDMVVASGSGFATENGTYGATRTVKGVRVVDQAGNPFPGFVGFQADDGTTYVPAVQYTLTISGFVSGSDVVIYDAAAPSTGDGSNVLQTFDAVAGTSVGYVYTYAPGVNVRVGVFKAGKVPLPVGPIALTATDSTLPVSQQEDRNYAA